MYSLTYGAPTCVSLDPRPSYSWTSTSGPYLSVLGNDDERTVNAWIKAAFVAAAPPRRSAHPGAERRPELAPRATLRSVDADREARRAARANWPIRRTTLSAEGTDVIRGHSPSELVAIVHRLTMDAWAMTGKPVPNLPRDEWPGRILRPKP